MSGVNTIITSNGRTIVVKYESLNITIPGVTEYILNDGRNFIVNNHNVVGVVEGHLDDNITIIE